MESRRLHRRRPKTSASVLQGPNLELRTRSVNNPGSPQGQKRTRQRTFENPDPISDLASIRRGCSSPQIHRQFRHRDSAEPACLGLLNPNQHYSNSSLSTTQNVGQADFLRRQNRKSAKTKPLDVSSTALPPTPKNSISQSIQDPEPDQVVPATVCTSTPFVLPDPRKPPADQDNTSIWEAVMGGKKEKARANTTSLNAESIGARGTSGFESFLEKLLGLKLDSSAKYKQSNGPSRYFSGRQGGALVTKYVTIYSGEGAAQFADAIEQFIGGRPSKSNLREFFVEKIFKCDMALEPLRQDRGKLPFNEKAIKRLSERGSQFQGYDVSELRRGLADIRYIRLSPQERLEGRSTADTPNLPPAEKDLRGRCDVVFGMHHQHLPLRLSTEDFPCHDPSAQICSIWLRVEFKKGDEQQSIKTARHQWAVGAFLDLQSRVRMIRSGKSGSYLSDPSSTEEFRQYGYIICGARVEVWEMRVICSGSTQGDHRRDTFHYEKFFQFPTKKLAVLDLSASPDEVEDFCNWHTMIMTWGFNVYSRQ